MKPRSEFFDRIPFYALRFGLVALAGAAFLSIPAWAECNTDALNALKIPGMTVTSTAIVSAAAPNPAYCDVKGAVATSGENVEPGSANFEIKLPQNWNGK